MSSLPLAEYALLSDCHSAALVSRAGSVDWLCLPRFDSPAVFGRLLDEAAGRWSLRPVGEATAARGYADGTLVLETRWACGGGEAVVTDALAMAVGDRGHELGSASPHALLRHVRGVRGEVDLELEFAPRPEYGVVLPLIVEGDGGVVGRGGAALVRLCSPVPLEVADSTARARLRVRAGESVGFALRFAASIEPVPELWTPEDVERRLRETAAAWRSWSRMHQAYQGPWKELVHGSGRVLQALTYATTGAIVAAPTTSLPERVGGVRNWDYRYCWVRDASLTLRALWVAACPDEATRFFDFLARAALPQVRSGTDLQVVFGIGGEHDLTERELPHLSGWRRSRPVRIGNGAWVQRQLDVYGELLDAAWMLRDQISALGDVARELLAAAADGAAARWPEPDHGIWEIRGEPQHFVHSKLMCWVALDRAIRMADFLRADAARVERWRAEAGAVRRAILERGWSDAAGAFVQSFGGDILDASALVPALVGFLPAGDPRMRSTIEAVAARLTDDRGLVYRYRAPDGLAGGEGAFLLCTFWLAEAWALAGETARARATFEAAAAHANDLGLLAEEVDSASGELLGNFPQAFSHIGLVNAAWAISQAETAR
ncbi:MAG TPA: glycoside hydrolase family 15 protein [Longimicrobiales bacterium]|nr:glycoside hydrolase family 15 protein [Longimicrobiales bacterium]